MKNILITLTFITSTTLSANELREESKLHLVPLVESSDLKKTAFTIAMTNTSVVCSEQGYDLKSCFTEVTRCVVDDIKVSKKIGKPNYYKDLGNFNGLLINCLNALRSIMIED